MEFKEAMRIWERMCKEFGDGCEGCPLGRLCSVGLREYPEESETILTKWQEEHPEKTIADDFFEKHPKAPRDDENTPYPCAKDCGYSKPPYCERIPFSCSNCWRRPLEEARHETN